MQQQNRPKLIVSLSEAISQDPNNQLQEQVADIINSLQNRILAVPEKTSDYDLKVVLLDGDAKRPYYRPKPIARSDPDADHRFEIDIAFYEKRGIKLQLEYYVCYLFSVTVLQYLYREVVGSEYQIFQTLDYPNISYLAWNGLIPSHATQTFENFSSSAEPTGLKLHIDAVLSLRNAAQPLLNKLHEQSGQVVALLRPLAIPSNFSFESRVLPAFMAANQEVVKKVTADIVAETPKAWMGLVNLLNTLTIRDSLELLKGLAAAGKLDSETKDYAQAAVEELSGKTGKARAQALDNDEPSELPRTLVVDHGMPIETGAEVEFADDQSSGQQDAKGFAQGIDLKPAPADATMSAPNPDVKITEEQARTGWYGLTGDSEETDDALGYESYARALAQVIADRNTKPPLTIGICAPWGRGKSVLMGLIRQEIEKLNLEIKESLTPLEHNCRTCKTLKFDAWRYSKAENVWAGFIDTVLRELQKGFKGRLRKLALAFKLNRGLDLPLLRQFGVFLAALVLILIAVVLAFPHDKSVSLPLLAGAAIAFCGKYLSGAWKLASSPITERVLQLSRLPDYQSRLDPIHKILDHIETVTQEYAKIPAKKSVERFVVFVDDIDRCKPEKIMETLEAIKHFLYLPQFVFVIAMDARVVRHAIGQHYDFMGDESHQKEEMGRFYLEKMLQIPFSLPPVGGEQLKDLNDVLLKEYVEDESESVIPGNSDSEPPSDKAPSDSPLKDDTNNSDESLDLAEGDADVRKKFGVDEEALRVLEEKNSESEIERLRIGKDEKRSIVGILETPGVAMSPRLFKRFINIYLIARYLHFERLKRLALDEKLPPVDLSKWLALSIIFPFESKALLQWWEENGWSNPLAEADGPFKPNGDFRLVEPDKKLSAPRKRPNTSAMFGGLDWPSLDEFGRALRALEIDPQTVKITRHITDCFNLVLD